MEILATVLPSKQNLNLFTRRNLTTRLTASGSGIPLEWLYKTNEPLRQRMDYRSNRVRCTRSIRR
jgi:hypothetical protein